MMKERILITALCLSLLSFGWAEAQSASRVNRAGPELRIDNARVPEVATNRAPRSVAPRSAASARRPANGVGIRSSSPSRSAPSRSGQQPNYRNPGQRGHSGLDQSPLGGLLGQYLQNEYGSGYHNFDPYAGQKAQAKAYRDAAITNAVVNVVGILATAHQQQQYAVVAPAPAPRGYVERQRVLVHEGRIEEYQVWVPQYTIPATGEVVLGHHETRRREIPPVYEEREVWIPAP